MKENQKQFKEFLSIKKFPHFIQTLAARPPLNDQKAVAGAGGFI